MFLVILAEVVFWSVFILIVSSETMRIQRRIKSKNKKNKINGRNSINTDMKTYYSADRLISSEEREQHETFNHRFNKEHGLREMRKHLRTMKWKYYQNHENLVLFCHYKRISDKYYSTLQHF